MSFGFTGIDLDNIHQVEFQGDLILTTTGTALTFSGPGNPNYFTLDAIISTFSGGLVLNSDLSAGTALEVTGGDFLWTTDGDGQIGYEFENRPNNVNAKNRITIGHTGSNQNLSAALSIISTTLGFMPPVMTSVQRLAINSPDLGLTVYDSDILQLMSWNGSAWATINFIETDPLSIHLNGDNSPTAVINWGGFRIVNVGNPISSQDVATKFYVDSSSSSGLLLDGSNSPLANISWGGFQINNLADPTSAQDAATKNYVDTSLVTTGELLYLALDGSNSPSATVDWGTQRLTNLGTPTLASDAATKAYVDMAQSAIHTDGSNTPSADISWASHKIINLSDPISAQDAATKAYVDAAVAGGSTPSIHLDGSNSPSADISWAQHKITNLNQITFQSGITTYGTIGIADSGLLLNAPVGTTSVTISGAGNGVSINGGNLIFSADNTHDLGALGNTNFRPRNGIFSGGIVAGSGTLVGAGLNNALINGIVVAGSNNGVDAIMGSSTITGYDAGILAFAKQTNYITLMGFSAHSAEVANNVYFTKFIRNTGRIDYLKFDDAGTLTFLGASGANLLWNTDGAGDIGTASNRPNNIRAAGKVLAASGLGVGNSASASALGTVVKKMEVFDASGTSLGFVPIFDAIS